MIYKNEKVIIRYISILFISIELRLSLCLYWITFSEFSKENKLFQEYIQQLYNTAPSHISSETILVVSFYKQ